MEPMDEKTGSPARAGLQWWQIAGLALAGALLLAGGLKFSRMLDKSRDGSTMGSLSTILSAIAIYRSDTEGLLPKRLEDLVGKYIDAIPPEMVTRSNRSTAVFDGKGGWFYSPDSGELRVNVEGKDKSGHSYRDYGYE